MDPVDPNFEELLARADRSSLELKSAMETLDQRIEALREVCPHLAIAVAAGWGSHGRDVRVCRHCGIQEIQWNLAFQTLTSPGGTWYETSRDRSVIRRRGRHPVLFPMRADEAYKFRRGPHKDVTEN